ncbi:ureidoglycolate lyase [Raoultella ornithinolytica]|uniref:Ureidoglycolate lyase n=1 Tax=Raoultella ornithinolytica TaxID=54291 RepID=A0ABD7QD85_RAOOR|nr:ureidoglycolate lyase [Raoultella ornithinolytica]
MLTVPLIAATAENLAPYAKYVGLPANRTPSVDRTDITYFHDVGDANDFTDTPVASFLKAKPHPFTLSNIERHMQTEEAVIPLTGESVMILGPAGEFDINKLVAIHLDGSFAIIMRRNVWHFAPFPLHGEDATYMLLSGRHTPDDIEVLKIDTVNVPGVKKEEKLHAPC